MKGKTIIELTDHEGNTEIHEDENMVTNALKYYLANGGAVNTTAFNNDSLRLNALENILGGVLLFDSEIEEKADNIFPPGGAVMVGNGAIDTVSNDEVTEMGSYNSSESGWQPDGSFKMVYDFSTTQANGTIKSVCLTSKNHGYVGEGNSISGKTKSVKFDDSQLSGDSLNITVDGNSLINLQRIVNVDYKNSIISVIDYNNIFYSAAHVEEHFSQTGKIKICNYLLPLSMFDVRSSNNKLLLVSTQEIDVPAEFLSFIKENSRYTYNRYSISLTDAFYIVAFTGNGYAFTASDPIQILKITPDRQISTYKVSNQTSMPFPSSASKQSYYVCLENKVLISSLATATEGKVYLIDITNPADFSEIAKPDDLKNDSLAENMMFRYASKSLTFRNCKLDVEKKALYLNNQNTNTYIVASVAGNQLFRININNNLLKLMRMMDYLATINNLDEAVVKTSDKTMKVTYILTFDGEDDGNED